MKKLRPGLVLLVSFCTAWGQQDPSTRSIHVSTAIEEPQSNIDLLRKSLQQSSTQITGVASETPRPRRQQPQPKPEEDPSAAEKAAAAQQEAIAAAQAQAAQMAASAISAANSSGTLDMPLDIGGTSVQTVVEPVVNAHPKKLSPAAAKELAIVKQKKEEASKPKPTSLEQDIENNNSLLPASAKVKEKIQPDTSAEEQAADAELEYAVKMLQQSKQQAQSAERRIQPPAAQNKPSQVPVANKKFDPNAFRPNVTWIPSKSTHFDIYTQKRSSGISSSNMSMTFESAYQTLRRFIPWMMSARVRVFVYQDHTSYLKYEPNARAWSRAVAYPTRGEIVVYDEPGKTQELKEVFTHELTHIFTQNFFDSHKTGRIMTPLWLDEGLAVLMEDQAYNGSRGGPWANDFRTLNFQRPRSQNVAQFRSNSMFGRATKFQPPTNNKHRGKPQFFIPFEQFMQEDSLQAAEGRKKAQDWYFQAYTMVRFLLNPAGGASPSNRMQFEQFTRLLAQGEPLRNPSTGFLVKDSRGQIVYEPYSIEDALGRAYRYGTIENFEDNFWRWADRR